MILNYNILKINSFYDIFILILQKKLINLRIKKIYKLFFKNNLFKKIKQKFQELKLKKYILLKKYAK